MKQIRESENEPQRKPGQDLYKPGQDLYKPSVRISYKNVLCSSHEAFRRTNLPTIIKTLWPLWWFYKTKSIWLLLNFWQARVTNSGVDISFICRNILLKTSIVSLTEYYRNWWMMKPETLFSDSFIILTMKKIFWQEIDWIYFIVATYCNIFLFTYIIHMCVRILKQETMQLDIR